MYESQDPEWHEIQSIIFTYFNELLEKYKSKTISGEELLTNLNFPEIDAIGFGYCKTGVKGKGTHRERAQLIKRSVFDNPDVQKFGIETLAKLAIQIDGFGPDLLSDLVANFALFNLIKYTNEQVETFDLKTMPVSLNNGYDLRTKAWKPAIKVNLPYFDNGEYRLLVPRHISRRMPILSSDEFYKGFLKYVLQDEEISRRRMLSTIGKTPKISIKEIEARLEKDYESLGAAAKKIAEERPSLVVQYSHNPHKYDSKRKPRKPKINWAKYAEELKALPSGDEYFKEYAECLRKILTAMYGENLLRGRLETKSVDGIYRYDINFVNASTTSFFRAVKNQQIVSGVIIVESKNYGKTKVSNKEFNQGLGYGIYNARELVFLAKRSDVTEKDIERSKSILLRHKVLVFPISDKDICEMLEYRSLSDDSFDNSLVGRLQDILSA